MKKEIKKFKEETGYSLTEKEDGFYYSGSLDLEGTAITSLPDNLTVGGFLSLRGTSITSLPDNLTVGGSLDLVGTSITSLPDNLTVGGSLDLRGASITSLPDNLTVGGYLDLVGTSITSLPDNLTVGGYLDLRGIGITDIPAVNRNAPDVFFWRNRTYTKADGVFSKVVSQRGNIYKISNRDKSEYEYLTLKSEISFEEAIEMYRVITGACGFGTKDFVNNRLNKKKSMYTISEIIELTKGEYGNSLLKSFFNENT